MVPNFFQAAEHKSSIFFAGYKTMLHTCFKKLYRPIEGTKNDEKHLSVEVRKIRQNLSKHSLDKRLRSAGHVNKDN